MFFSVTGVCSFPFVWGLMAGLPCSASHRGIISICGLAANSGSPYILQPPNLHLNSDAVVNGEITLFNNLDSLNNCKKCYKTLTQYWSMMLTSGKIKEYSFSKNKNGLILRQYTTACSRMI